MKINKRSKSHNLNDQSDVRSMTTFKALNSSAWSIERFKTFIEYKSNNFLF